MTCYWHFSIIITNNQIYSALYCDCKIKIICIIRKRLVNFIIDNYNSISSLFFNHHSKKGLSFKNVLEVIVFVKKKNKWSQGKFSINNRDCFKFKTEENFKFKMNKSILIILLVAIATTSAQKTSKYNWSCNSYSISRSILFF